jgi:hypothetical protein
MRYVWGVGLIEARCWSLHRPALVIARRSWNAHCACFLDFCVRAIYLFTRLRSSVFYGSRLHLGGGKREGWQKWALVVYNGNAVYIKIYVCIE